MPTIFDSTQTDLQATEQFERITTGLEEVSRGITNDEANKRQTVRASSTNRATAQPGMRSDSSQTDQQGSTSRGPVRHTPWFMTTVAMRAANQGLYWNCNPSDISWTMAQRSSLVKTVNGTVLHVWPNTDRNTFYDEPKISLNLQSGSIIPEFYDNTGNGATTGIYKRSQGLSNFYDFLQIVDSPKITDDGRPNYVIIEYNSNIFPAMTLTGWFDPAGVRFNDTSGEPNKIDSLSVDFIILETTPKISTNQLQAIFNANLSNQYDNTFKKKPMRG